MIHASYLDIGNLPYTFFEGKTFMNDIVFLIGYRGVGKTTLGQRLADRLGFTFLDTDQLICEKKGKPVREIVVEGGWKAFRRCEESVLSELFDQVGSVIATGGGAILHRQIWRKLREETTVIWLTADRDVICKRLAGDDSTDAMRPSLTGKGVCEELEEVLTSREPLYRETSHFKIDTGKMNVEDAIERIMAELSLPSGKKE